VRGPAGGDGYQLVQLTNGTHSLHSLAYGETFHPVIGPVAEAEALYVKQLQLRKRLKNHSGDFVIWDVGLGAAANALTVLRATRDLVCPIRLVSFDCTIEPLTFALQHAAALGYFGGYETQTRTILGQHIVQFTDGAHEVNWQLHVGDFPTWLAAQPERRTVAAGILPAVEPGDSPGGRAPDSSRPFESLRAGPGGKMPPSTAGGTPAATPPPHVILFDAFSPAKNPAMWTLPLFTDLFRQLDPQRPCALPTYSRSTIMRVTLLLAGFFVGVGHATGEKEETTIAANTLKLLTEPLNRRWLDRARRSHSAEPMVESVYRIAPLAAESWGKLQAHPQFK
jgi:tRNA U34 5-methylaminomethyl-2-thiouridine-forming methyltransferase MnmC